MERKYTFLKFLSAITMLLLGSFSSFGQATGTLTVPSVAYPTLDSAIKYLNKVGVGTGGVTVNVTAAQAQTSKYLLGSATLNASTSAANPITINGNGNTVTSYVGTSTTVDGMFIIQGTDYVTINGLNLQDNSSNTTSTTQMEWGYALLKLNSTVPLDGCQNVKILNCTITLNKANTVSTGIYANNHVATSTTRLVNGTVVITGTAQSDANSFNLFQGNAIQNVNFGFQFLGTGTGIATTTDLYDSSNRILNNTIQNFGTNVNSYGVYVDNNTNVLVRGNTINNTAGSTGSAPTSYVYGINQGGTNASAKIISNNINISGSSYLYCINTNASGDTLAADSNVFKFTSTGSGYMYGINASATARIATLNANILTNDTIAGTGYLYFIYHSGATQGNGSLTINDNKITNITRTGSSGGYYYIYQGGSVASNSTVYVRRNKVANIINPSTGYYYTFGMYCFGGASPYPVKYIEYDTMDNVSSGLGYMYGLYNSNAGTGSQLSYGYVNNITCGYIYGLYSGSTFTNGEVHHNVVKGVNSISTTSCYSTYLSGPGLRFHDNLITNIESAVTSGTLYGIYTFTSDTMSYYNNVISDLRTPSASAVSPLYGIYFASGTNSRVYNNTINLNATSTGTNFGATGIYYVSTNTNFDIQNNIIRVNVTPAGTGYTVALRRNTGTAGVQPSNLSLNSNKNIYYTPTATNSYLYAEGTATPFVNAYNITSDPSFNTPCGLYKTFMSPRENGTFTENNLIATGTTAGVFAPSGTSYAKNNSSVISYPSIPTDFYGVTRPAFPDGGAVQFTGTGTDAAGPLVQYSPLPSTIYCATPPVITATITDPSGVNVTAGTKPRLYYKKSIEANAFGGFNTSAINGWKWVEGANVGNTFTFTPDYSLLTSTLGLNDSITYFIVAQDNNATPNVTTVLAAYPSGYCPASVALTAAAGPLSTSITPYGYKYLPRPAFSVISTPKNICLTATVKFSLNTPANGLAVRWQSRPVSGGTYTQIPGTGTGSSDSALNVTTSTYIRAVFTCGTTIVDSTLPDTVFVTSPQLLTVDTAQGRCGPGTLTFNATSSAGNTINWYTTQTGGTAIATGSPFTTPTLNTTTQYYAAARSGSSYYSGGLATPVPVYSTYFISSNYGLGFNANQDMTLSSVDVYGAGTAGASNSLTVYLQNSAGVTLQTATFTNITLTSGGTVPTTLNLNFTVPMGTGYRLLTGAYSGMSGLTYSYSTLSFPYSVPNVFSITTGLYSSSFATTSYYYFYNWQVAVACETPRQLVNAYIGVPVNNPTVTTQGPTTICNKDSAVLKATPTGAGFRYQWYKGGNAIPGATDSVYKPTTAGTYTASIFSVPGCGGFAGNSVTISVNFVPTTVTPAGPLIVCTGNTDTLTAPSGAGFTYQWFNNNIPVSGGTNQKLVINSSGNYKVRVTNTNIGCSDTSAIVVVSVQGAPPATIIAPNQRGICPGGSITLSTPVVNGLTYQWRRNGTDIAGATGLTYTTTQPGTYVLRVSAGRGCISFSDSVILTQSQAPPTTFTPTGAANICGAGNSLTLTATTGTYNYQWYFNNAPISGATNYNYSATAAGNYRLRITSLVTGCTDSSANKAVQVVPLPTVSTSPSGNITICSLDSLNIRAVSNTAIQWQWSLNGDTIANTTGSVYTAKNTSGAYTVRVRDNNGCQSAASAPVNLTVNPSPTANITYSTPLTFCQGGGVVLNAQTELGNKIQWITNGIAIQNDTLPYKNVMTTGTYSIRTSNGYSCLNNSPTLQVTVVPAPQPIITRLGSTLSVVNGPYSSYQWYRNSQLIPGANQDKYTAVVNGGYSVRVVDANTCEATSSSIVIGTVSVVNTSVGQLKLYPNPTTSTLFIESPVAVRIVVRDITGKTLLSEKDVNQVDLSPFADGMYLVYVFDTNGQPLMTEKVTKTTAR